MKKDFITTYSTEIVILIANLLTYRLAATCLHEEGFSLYALWRRNISFIQPVLLLGLGVGLPRFIALTQNQEPKKSNAFVLSALLLLVAVLLCVILLLAFFKEKAIFLLFGSVEYDYLAPPLMLFLSGLVLHSFSYSYYRGKLYMKQANFLQLINLGIAPLVSFFMDGIETILFFNGIIMCLSCFISIFLIIKGIKWNWEEIRISCKHLFLYGIQRVPGDMSMAALFALPAIFTAHYAGIRDAGFVAFSISLLNMTSSFFSPISIISLPKAAQWIAQKDFTSLRRFILRIMAIIGLSTVAGVLVYEFFAENILHLYLGFENQELTTLTRIIFPAVIAYSLFMGMRSFIDAYYYKGINTLNQGGALFIFIVLSFAIYYLNKSHIDLIIGFVISLYILSFLTLMKIVRIIKNLQKEINPDLEKFSD